MIKNNHQIFKSNWFYISILILFLSIVYFRTFYHGLIFLDDDTLIYTKFSGMNLAEKISYSFSSNYLDVHYYRPITLLSIISDSLFNGQSFFIYHLTNFLVHLLTCICIYFILKTLGSKELNSLLTTLLFAVSPLQINAVGWIAGRGDLLAGFFSCAALLAFMYFLRKERVYLLILVSLLLFLAFLSKEVSLFVPFLFLVIYFIEKKIFILNKTNIAILMMIAVVIGAYYLLRGVFLTSVYVDKFSFTTYYKNVLVLPETISKFFIPIGIKALPGIEKFTSISGTILLLILIILPLIIKSINKPRYFFGLMWFILLLLPGMVFRTMTQDGFYYWDCRSYLPLIGFIFIIGEILNRLDRKHLYSFYGIIILYIMILGTVSYVKIGIYESPVSYWSSVKADYPSSFLPYEGLFNYYNFNNETENAERQLLQAIKLRPEELIMRNMLINFYEKQNSSEKEEELLKRTLIDDKIYSDNFANKYLKILYKKGKIDDFNRLIDTCKENITIEEFLNKIPPELHQKMIKQ